jgi:autotransporter translocation and assembly factor TamB
MVELTGGLKAPAFLVIGSVNSPGFEIEDLAEAKLGGNFSWGGTPSRSELRGTLKVEKAKVTRSFGLGDLMRRSPRVVVIRKADDPRANVKLDLDLEIEEGIDIESNLAKLSIEGGATVGGTMLAPRLSGSFRAGSGTFTYLRNEFTIEELSVDFIEAARRDPYIRLTGVSEVESRTGELYRVTARFNGYLNDAVPELSSVPVLSEGDIASLLTFGDTFGVIVSGEGASGSSGDNFSNLARRAFLSNAFGLAEKQLERLLDLDRIDIDEEALTSGNAAEADLMLEKEFGSRVRVNYTTSVGRFSNQRVEVSFELMKRLWLQTRTNPEGNHAIGVKLQVPFK